MTSLRIVFMGSPDFSIPPLLSLIENLEIAAIVTQPDRPSGRGRQLRPSAVKTQALKSGIPVLEPQKINSIDFYDQLVQIDPDMIVVAAYGQILRKNILELPRYGCLNVHASLLPRWRGASPIQAAILEGDDRTGVTIMLMDEGLDTGPILSQQSIPLSDSITGGELFEALSEIGASLLVSTISDYISGKITPTQQDEERSTYAPMLKKNDGHLDFFQSAPRLSAQVRAYEPWPTSFFSRDGHRIVVRSAHAVNAAPFPPGTAFIHENFPAVTCKDGSLILDSLQPAGSSRMDGDAYLHGKHTFQGKVQ